MTLSKLPPQITFLCLAVVALEMRLYQLDADTPNYFAGLNQALLTDPYHITVHARSKVLFDEWDPFGYERWVAFKVSLVSGVAYLLFSFFEVSRYIANLGSTLLSLFGSVFVVLGIFISQSKSDRKKELVVASLIAAVLLAVSHPMIVYGRTPFLENGLLLLSGATFFVMMRYGHTVWGAALVGALVALCPLAGKLFGIMIAAPVLLALMLSGDGAGKRLVTATLSGAITAGFWYLFVLGDQTGAYHAYLQEQSLGLYGFPRGLQSVKNFIVQLISYGAEFRLFKFHLALPAVLLLGVVGLLSRYGSAMFQRGFSFWKDRPALTFFAGWVIVSWIGLMIFQYRPLRYSLFVLLPLIGLIACLVGESLSSLKELSDRTLNYLYSWKVQLFLLSLLWFVITQFQFVFVEKNHLWERFNFLVWSSLGGAILAMILFNLLRGPLRSYLGGRSFQITILAALVVSLLSQGYWYTRLASNMTHDFKAISHDLAQLIPGQAVITGPYAPNLTMDNNHKCLIYSFGLARDDADLFERFPITHMTFAEGNITKFKEKFPSRANSPLMNRWMFREMIVTILQTEEDYAIREPGIDRVVGMLSTAGNLDSAYSLASSFNENYPDNRRGRQNLFHVLMSSQRYDEALQFGREVFARDNTDFSFCLTLARACFFIGNSAQREGLRVEGEKYRDRAIELNPAAEIYISKTLYGG